MYKSNWAFKKARGLWSKSGPCCIWAVGLFSAGPTMSPGLQARAQTRSSSNCNAKVHPINLETEIASPDDNLIWTNFLIVSLLGF